MYGVTTAMSSGRTPALTRVRTCFRTSAASISLLLLSPWRPLILPAAVSSSSVFSGKSPPCVSMNTTGSLVASVSATAYGRSFE